MVSIKPDKSRKTSCITFIMILLSVIAASLFLPLSAQALETVTLQLKWLHQFQFAGYYAAKAKGYYRDAGLEVSMIEAKPGKSAIDSVLDGTAQYGVDVTRLLLARSEGKPVVALGVIFQHSPYILVTRSDSPSKNIHDLSGKRLMLEEKADDVLAYLKKEGLPNDRYTPVRHTFNPQDLVDGKVDAISAYSTNELFFLDKTGFRYQAYTPRSAGIDFYGDTLFTTEQELKTHPSRVKAFRDASLRGWKYAMANPEEIADLIIAQYSQRKSREHLLFEARQMAALIQSDLIELGYMNPGRWRHIADTYVDLGMLPRNFSFGGFIYDPDPRSDNTQIVNLAKMLGICLIGAIIFAVLLRQQVRRKTRTIVESAEQYQTILQSTPDGFWCVGREGRLVDVNDCYVELSGYSREELIGMPVEQLEVHDSAEDVQERIKTLVNDGFIRFESQHKRKDGIIWEVEVSASYLPAKNEMIVFLRDITESKQAEKLIKVNEERLRAIMDNTDSVIYMKDIESKYITINRRFEELFKVNRREVLGKTDYDIFPKEIAAAFQETDHTVFNLGKPLSLEEIAPQDDGIHTYASIKFPLFGADGRPFAVCGISNDITERKRAEEEKIKLESQLYQSQKMESIGSLAGGVAHDFNNKLSVILGCTYMAFTEEDQAHRQTLLDEVRKAAEQSADLTRQLLTFASKQTISTKILDLNETVSGMLKMLHRLLGEDIKLNWQPAADLWLLKLDPSQIDQVLANLCVNARDSITTDGMITIETLNCVVDIDSCVNHPDASPGKYVRLLVSDNGSGMGRETLDRIFEPFFTTKEPGKGTGLGLATVFGIVKQNNGFINVYSEPGQGTTFSIYFPRHVGKSSPVQNQGMAIDAPTGKETILLVEDELAILNMASMILTKHGYTVLQANTPGEAIRLADEQSGNIDLLITDVVMPEMNGKELAHKLMTLNPILKCIFISGYTADAISQHVVLDEGVNFIQKPFSLPDLAVKVREVLDGK